MNKRKSGDNITINTLEEYHQFYSSYNKEKQSKGSRYYKMGVHIAKLACFRAESKI